MSAWERTNPWEPDPVAEHRRHNIRTYIIVAVVLIACAGVYLFNRHAEQVRTHKQINQLNQEWCNWTAAHPSPVGTYGDTENC